MLESETKRRIDTARDILVGKVPDPKSQVEQITIALIYKFMDDMDRESVEMGGKASFFTGEYKRYRWSKIFDPRLGGHEMLNLYAEAIVKLNQNASIPQLFRDIFKNAYLPYRDPETLKLFLETINEFAYDHSENLGDAFEYLLSVLGSQGDAGQFRTPRNIIDFMVAVIDPQKNEVIIDPACGTAGFLISSYRHIIKANTKKVPGDLLTTSERKTLLNNFIGYDISPDMVRLSLVNLYLHGFSQPKIYEYDTLTSDERWNEYGNVLFANPPFMSPKGGIKPHKRFSVQSSRSEVLFVDYIAEHLTTSGRAAVIVPEGIIFQSGSAYKQLRKSLVEKYLYAVVSLPAGVFNPYSGVKTSILFFEPLLAQKSDSILFVKIENDGFSLGAQRRAIDRNDLPEAVKIIGRFRKQTTNPKKGHTVTLPASTVNNLVIPKKKFIANGDYSLSGERYREDEFKASTFPLVELGKVCELYQPKTITQDDLIENGSYLVFGANGVIGRYNQYNHEETEVIVTCRGATCGTVNRSMEKSWITGNAMVAKPRDETLTKDYLYAVLKNTDLKSTISGSAQPQITRQSLSPFQIPLPPIEVQQEIVTEIERHQKIIDGARQVIDNWKPHIDVDPDWPMVELREICETIMTGPFGTSLHQSDYVKQGIPVVNPQNIVEGSISINTIKMVSLATRNQLNEFAVREGDIIIGRRGEMGRCAVISSEMNGWLCGTGCFVIRLKTELIPRFAFFHIISPRVRTYLEEQAVGVTMKNLNQEILSSIQIPLPPLETQRTIVADIEAEQTLVTTNRELIARMEKKIQAVIARVWRTE
jgi:type I restriction enzyme M protein